MRSRSKASAQTILHFCCWLSGEAYNIQQVALHITQSQHAGFFPRMNFDVPDAKILPAQLILGILKADMSNLASIIVSIQQRSHKQ